MNELSSRPSLEERKILFNFFKEKSRSELVQIIIAALTNEMKQEILDNIREKP